MLLEAAFKDEKPPTWEKNKLKELKSIFIEALRQMAK